MYVVEGEEGGFTSIPISIYGTIVTLTTAGYGDISPITPLGQAISSVVMIIGYGIIAVPTGIVSAKFANSNRKKSRAEKSIRALFAEPKATNSMPNFVSIAKQNYNLLI